ncbi:MAG: hypothetical protein A3C79_00695 [Candidatus Taylorbacteria bacterium RIFCSPHIGHO2_02_FULL_45_28]|uniref:DUF8128 domain-containing protein n=1 Tax=Candidatus Taylorbacteria bacterium RIFCSPHIGHO2_12_FULL_45_16 TaxID=1802315 RepID=A0A1G2MZ30_9BACT|nr:MAG: hypothetical protein A2830_01950 [Candidatus Taylorbacteria bacterium RIFCSPHIGHO2_01_FULL_44_110]OHA25538.1 MAG: hypothetical protein A3C79_00695 [Candidatus Taylorbacteria bacterium RIFCSPHIGHO2_02_FULL_45_28]OHA29205.1 MAG: hypothetical protein A3F51_01160 [Candidatus Taylorbacteria bacterium RIFCSPHIGHO2_12_FULL_45_16]OHA33427.1 MAG: hypothetical protein A3A23_02040 [Candidatus Taylorbacteria bacterium RIFCSPLOWO2_01_FULL_45_59]OHA44773.1 MAG: hypothetical protein A3G04_02905 [Candi
MPIEQLFPVLVDDFQSTILPQAIQYVIFISPVVLAVMLAVFLWPLWVRYVRAKQFLSLKYTVLEIKLPKDTFKSPLAMEVFLQSLHNTADGSSFAKYWKGETRPWYSLEIASIEGKVKFYIWTEDRRKGGVMSALYSQFPGVEVHESGDYTQSVHFDPKTMKIWAAEFKFTKPDPYPIKTYVDYGLDKDPKEEFKVDPLLPMLEFLGSVGPNQQIWIQILIRAHKDDQKKLGHWFKNTDTWQDEAKKLVNTMLIRDAKTKITGEIDPKTGKIVPAKEFAKLPTISQGERDIIEAIERSVTKLAFDAGIRALYIAKKEVFNTPFGIGGIIGNMKHFNTESLNGFKPNGDVWHNRLSDPWQDYKDIRRNRYAREGLAMYKRRSYFYAPREGKSLVLNTEELATIYHFPGSVAATPTLERLPSKKTEAPSNLPT